MLEHAEKNSAPPRKFNIAGSVIPERHYYVDLAPQIEKLMALAADGAYFVINRPRQFGKTTILNFFAQHLQASDTYAPALISFEDFTQRPDITEGEFYTEVAQLIREELNLAASVAMESPAPISRRRAFFDWLRALCEKRRLVLLIDEIDAVPETVVIGFLAGLRKMFLRRNTKPAPYCVCLAGVHDIKNLKAKYRDEIRLLGTASPFNIALDYELPPFSLENIRQYYLQHTQATGQQFEEKAIKRVHEVTNGHPWLVSVLAKSLVEKIAPARE